MFVVWFPIREVRIGIGSIRSLRKSGERQTGWGKHYSPPWKGGEYAVPVPFHFAFDFQYSSLQLLEALLRACADGLIQLFVLNQLAQSVDGFLFLQVHHEIDQRDLNHGRVLASERLHDAAPDNRLSPKLPKGINCGETHVDVRIVHQRIEKRSQYFTVGLLELITPVHTLQPFACRLLLHERMARALVARTAGAAVRPRSRSSCCWSGRRMEAMPICFEHYLK